MNNKIENKLMQIEMILFSFEQVVNKLQRLNIDGKQNIQNILNTITRIENVQNSRSRDFGLFKSIDQQYIFGKKNGLEKEQRQLEDIYNQYEQTIDRFRMQKQNMDEIMDGIDISDLNETTKIILQKYIDSGKVLSEYQKDVQLKDVIVRSIEQMVCNGQLQGAQIDGIYNKIKYYLEVWINRPYLQTDLRILDMDDYRLQCRK